jgi:hypothetical protein
MIFHWANLNEQDRAASRTITAFLNGRLEEQPTVDWALNIRPNESIKRLALLDLINSSDGRNIKEPWRSAWHLIEESWEHPSVEGRVPTGVHYVQQRLRVGERSGSLVAAIVELVEPRLKVEPFSELHLKYRKPLNRPKKVNDIFSTSMPSIEIFDPGLLGL